MFQMFHPEPMVRPLADGELVLAKDADGSVDLQDREPNLFGCGDAVFSERLLNFVRRDVFILQIPGDQLSVFDENGGRPLDHPPKPPVSKNDVGENVVEKQECSRGYQPPGHGGVRARHCILYGVGNEDQEHKIKRRHLSYFALSRQSKTDKNCDVDDCGTEDYFKKRAVKYPHGCTFLSVESKSRDDHRTESGLDGARVHEFQRAVVGKPDAGIFFDVV
jgi:hypothetical protein